MIIWIVTVFCGAVEVLVVGIPILVGDIRMDFTAGICEESNKKVCSVQMKS